MRTLRLEYTARAVAGGPWDMEHPGQLHVYATSDTAPSPPPPPLRGPADGARATLTLPCAGGDEIVHFCSFAFVRSFARRWALVADGYASISVRALWEHRDSAAPIDIKLGLPQARDATKCVVHITRVHWEGADPRAPSTVAALVGEAGAELRALVAAPARFAPTWPIIARIAVPIYRSMDTVLPGAAYALVPPAAGGPSAAFLTSALHMALRRFHVPRSKFGARTDADTMAAVLGQVVALYPSTCTYVTDKLWAGGRERFIEHFGMETARNAGDCEDGALVALHTFLEIKRTAFDDAQLAALHDFAQAYAGFMCLMGVSAPALAHVQPHAVSAPMGAADDNHGITGAHMSCILVPAAAVRRLVDEDDVVAALAPPAAIERSRAYPLIVCEPTGALHPTGGTPAEADATRRCAGIIRDALPDGRARRAALANGAFMSINPRTAAPSEKSFYRAAVMAFTPECVDECGVAHFVFTRRSSDTLGVDFGAVARPGGPEDVALRPAALMSPRAAAAARAVIARGYPSARLQPGRTPDIDAAAAAAFPPTRGGGARGVWVNTLFSYDSISARRVHAIGAAVREMRASAKFAAVDVWTESIRENVGNVVISFCVRPPAPGAGAARQ